MIATDDDLATALEWLKISTGWLNYFDTSHLSDPAKLLKERLEKAREDGRYNQAWDVIDDLKRLSNSSEVDESAEIWFACAFEAAKMGYLREAVELFREARGKYSEKDHNYAVVYWTLGCVQWLLPDKHINAINDWRKSVKIFKSLSDSYKSGVEHSRWYQERYEEMRMALKKATQKYGIPPLPPYGNDSMDLTRDDGTVSPNSELSEPQSEEQEFSTLIGIYSISEEIPAGGFGASGFDPIPFGRVMIDHVLIDNHIHRIVSVQGKNIVNLSQNERYMVIKVKGDSMDKDGIDSGDYVLLHWSNIANNNDIVAAEIVGVDNCATLKRFIRKGEKIILQPNSNNPVHQAFEFRNTGGKFYIRGKVIAIFKPI